MSIIEPIYKNSDEGEYTPPWRNREQDQVRTCPHSSVEWTSELQGERKPVARAGNATVTWAKGISALRRTR